jgi:hypothetical protein
MAYGKGGKLGAAKKQPPIVTPFKDALKKRAT